MSKYRRIKRDDRVKIESYVNAGYTQSEIARIIGVDRSTICRELRRGAYEKINSDYTTQISYSCDMAQMLCDYNNTAKGKELKIADDHALASFIEHKIMHDKYSPDAVIHYIKNHPEISGQFKTMISTTTLYRYIDKGLFLNLTNKDLPHNRKRKYRRVRIQKRKSAGTSIEKRPDITSRENCFDWEMDTVKGKRGTTKGCLLVLTERKTRHELVFKLADQKSESVVNVLNGLEERLRDDFRKIFHSITVDNGVEFSDFSGMQKSRYKEDERTYVYYCHAYSSGERGTNENNNRLIRRHAPKGMDLDKLQHDDVKYIQRWMNNYPRKILGYKTSGELFAEELRKAGLYSDIFF